MLSYRNHERTRITKKTLLAVGGTDPSGGAGLPADIKTAFILGVHACPVVCAVTIQDSGRVSSWTALNGRLLEDQVAAVLDDGPVSAVKSGMLGSSENCSVLAHLLESTDYSPPYVLDPVAASGSGTPLLEGNALDTMIRRLFPLAALVTPNIHEAESISGVRPVNDPDSMEKAGRIILGMGAGAVLVKGGHLSGDPCDILVTPDGVEIFRGGRITGDAVHGTGCTLASACASMLALGFSLEDAVKGAKILTERVISRRFKRKNGFLPGHGPDIGPLPSNSNPAAFYLPPAYCSSCGNPMTATGTGPGARLFCTNCGFVHYRNPLPAVTLIVRRNDEVLLVRRAEPPAKGELCFPGGFMETGETPLECGKRELEEETGLTAERYGLFDIEIDSTPYGGILLIVLEVYEWKGTPAPGDDASEVLFVAPDEIDGLAFKAHERLAEKLGRLS